MLLFHTKGYYNFSCHSWEPRPVTSVHSHTAKFQFMANLNFTLILDIWRFSFFENLTIYLKMLILSTCIHTRTFCMKLHWCTLTFMLLKVNFCFKIYFSYIFIYSYLYLYHPEEYEFPIDLNWFCLFINLAVTTNITKSQLSNFTSFNFL